ncbi:MAG TPA: energy transducer TonB, partial [Pyrinomonadaceae bacterium]|nr:energy transducer TonB [Pyrinomonadaceae bacterium]
QREPALNPYRTRMNEAAERLEAFAAARPQDPSAESWREQAQSLRLYGRRPNERGLGPDIYTSSQVTTRALIVAKPEPAYTEEAREEHTSGVVRLRAVLGSDGHVRNIVAMRRLPNGLTEKAVEAARRIRFTPAKLGGQPVSQLVVLEYSFKAF